MVSMSCLTLEKHTNKLSLPDSINTGNTCCTKILNVCRFTSAAVLVGQALPLTINGSRKLIWLKSFSFYLQCRLIMHKRELTLTTRVYEGCMFLIGVAIVAFCRKHLGVVIRPSFGMKRITSRMDLCKPIVPAISTPDFIRLRSSLTKPFVCSSATFC